VRANGITVRLALDEENKTAKIINYRHYHSDSGFRRGQLGKPEPLDLQIFVRISQIIAAHFCPFLAIIMLTSIDKMVKEYQYSANTIVIFISSAEN
jgi:hypothetical protein